MKDSWPVDWKDYYEILQVIPEAEPEVIEGAYKKLAAKYHPDNKGTGDADRFRAIHEAHEILTHPGKKRNMMPLTGNGSRTGTNAELSLKIAEEKKDPPPYGPPLLQRILEYSAALGLVSE
jgi:DnaJ-class molecular chaperone